MKNVIKSLAKQQNQQQTHEYIKETLRLGVTTLIISNEVIYDIMKITKSLEESSLLIKGVSEKIKN